MGATQKSYIATSRATEEAKKEIAAILQNLKDQTGTMIVAINVKYRGGKVDQVKLNPIGAM